MLINVTHYIKRLSYDAGQWLSRNGGGGDHGGEKGKETLEDNGNAHFLHCGDGFIGMDTYIHTYQIINYKLKYAIINLR